MMIKNMKNKVLLIVFILLLTVVLFFCFNNKARFNRLSSEEKAEYVLNKMTLDEKIAQMLVIYYTEDTQNGYLLNITRDGWVQVISAPITDISLVPEEEKDKVPVAVGGLIDAINETKNYVDEKISSSSAGSIDGGEI